MDDDDLSHLEPTDPPHDPLGLLDLLTPYRETLRGMRSALMEDGWTREEAQALVVQIMTHKEQDDES